MKVNVLCLGARNTGLSCRVNRDHKQPGEMRSPQRKLAIHRQQFLGHVRYDGLGSRMFDAAMFSRTVPHIEIVDTINTDE